MLVHVGVRCSETVSPETEQCLSQRSVQEEFETYRTTAEAMTESKDAELAKALKSNAALRQQLAGLQSRNKEVCLQSLHSCQGCSKSQSPLIHWTCLHCAFIVWSF